MKGLIKSYNSKKGFGFISAGGKELFFHVTQLKFNSKKIEIGKEVSFEERKNEQGYVAENIYEA